MSISPHQPLPDLSLEILLAEEEVIQATHVVAEAERSLVKAERRLNALREFKSEFPEFFK